MTLWPSSSSRSNATNAIGLPGRWRTSAAVAGHRLAVQHGRRGRPAEFAQPGEAGEPDQLAAGAPEGVHGAMVAHMDLGPLAAELGLGDVARVREPARVLQAGGEHRGDEGHGDSSIVAISQIRGPGRIETGTLATCGPGHR
jgi:hypothetical protein